MEDWETRVMDTLTDPMAVYLDRYDAMRECFYKLGTPTNPDRLLKVVVEFNAEGRGTIITAYPSRNIPTGERQKWP